MIDGVTRFRAAQCALARAAEWLHPQPARPQFSWGRQLLTNVVAITEGYIGSSHCASILDVAQAATARSQSAAAALHFSGLVSLSQTTK